MRTSQYIISTLKEIPKDINLISHQLMIRSGMIRQISSGIYTWLPTGFRVLNKLKKFIRKEMNNIGALEILMPISQPINLWKKSGRILEYGLELIKFIDRSKKEFILGPTHEEIITNIFKNEIISHKNLPLTFFQIQTKFRDEIRPRCGIIRSREFLMKDAYSFHKNQKSLNKTYEIIKKTYNNIFKKLNLKICIIKANNGEIGGNLSHEFHSINKNGEDKIIFSKKLNSYTNFNFFKEKFPNVKILNTKKKLSTISIYNKYTLFEISKNINKPLNKFVKTIVIKANKNYCHKFIVLMIRADYELNINKVKKLPNIKIPLTIITDKKIYKIFGIKKIFIGPVNFKFPIFIDYNISIMNYFISGANINNKYFLNINWKRDVNCSLIKIVDLCKSNKKNIYLKDKNNIKIIKGIEVGHIFQVGEKYSKKFNAKIQLKNNFKKPLLMGCYGIGISRILAAIIEQNHDKNGIIWPRNLSPFQVSIVPICMYFYKKVQKYSEKLYYELIKNGIDVLLDDRKETLGVMLKDMDLIGIPNVIIIGNNFLKNKKVEYKNRNNFSKKIININYIIDFILNKCIKN
ncbi:proline--tRNA ligase [Sodalis-like secondary symbiont of Drepanosiphum platanoidis]|uniref:proline--tRNA ligase n=1 Tax=Sodalis-like secondary symbiont of Drepanosiphum platanoidis TaxID=2994493 RepID=UPI00346471D0